METEDDTEEVCMTDVFFENNGVQSQFHHGACGSKDTSTPSGDVFLNTSLQLNVSHRLNAHSDYSSESEDTDGPSGEEEMGLDGKLVDCNNHISNSATVELVQAATSSGKQNQNCGKISSKGVYFHSYKDIVVGLHNNGTNAERDKKNNSSDGADKCAHRRIFAGLSHNCGTFVSDVGHLCDDRDLIGDREGGSHESNIREGLPAVNVYKTLNANNKLTDSLNALEKYLTFQLVKVNQKLRSVKTLRNVMFSGKFSDRPCIRLIKEEDLRNCTPYFQHPLDNDLGLCPPNEDSITKVTHSELVISGFLTTPTWSTGDKMQLKKAVQRVMSLKKLQSYIHTMTNAYPPLKRECKVLKTDVIDENDWKLISREVQGKHSAAECRGMWINHIQPSLKCKPFTEEEQSRLRTLVQHYGNQDWDAIAASLNTGHTALQCFILHMHINNDSRKYHWNGEENRRLQGQLLKNQIGRSFDWTRVIFHMQKSWKEVSDHWHYVANPNIKKGKFTENERAELLKGIKIFGHDFTKIARYLVPTRTSKQLRHHYKLLVSSSYMGNWSKEEDMNLLRIVEQRQKINWVAISKHFVNPVRTRSQVRCRYVTLKRWLLSCDSRYRMQTRHHIARMRERNRVFNLAKNEMFMVGAPKTRHRKKPPKTESEIDKSIKQFLHTNFVERRTEKSLRRAFVLTEEEANKQLYDVKKLLPLLNVNVNVVNTVLTTDVSISNRDKMVFYKLKKDMDDMETTESLSTPNVFKDAQTTNMLEEMVTSNCTLSSSSVTSALPPDAQQPSGSMLSIFRQESVLNNALPVCSSSVSFTGTQDSEDTTPTLMADPTPSEHSDFLLPSMSILDALIDVLLDNNLDKHHLDSGESDDNFEEDKCNESYNVADSLFLERLKTIFLCPLLISTRNVAMTENIIDTKVSVDNLDNLEVTEQEEACTSDEDKNKVKKPGRPRKKRKRIQSEEKSLPQLKRKYVRTGKYSRSNNITPRVNLRTSCRPMRAANEEETMKKNN